MMIGYVLITQLSGQTASDVSVNICLHNQGNIVQTAIFLYLVSEHQAALLQLKRECKEELEKFQVSVKTCTQCKTVGGQIYDKYIQMRPDIFLFASINGGK